MATNVTKPHKLGRKKKTYIAYLEGRIDKTEAGRRLGVTRQNFPIQTDAIFRHLVQSGKLDIKSLLNNY